MGVWEPSVEVFKIKNGGETELIEVRDGSVRARPRSNEIQPDSNEIQYGSNDNDSLRFGDFSSNSCLSDVVNSGEIITVN